MEIISISKLNNLYERISKKNKINPIFKTGILDYLNLSVHYSRDERDFDLINYELLKALVRSKRLNLRKIKKSKFSKYYYNYFFNYKEFEYLISIDIPILILKDIFKILKQLFDTSILFLLFLFTLLKTLLKIFYFQEMKFMKRKFIVFIIGIIKEIILLLIIIQI